MVIGQSFNMIGPTMDMIWVGMLGSASIAGVGVSSMAVMLSNSVMMGLSMGARALISRFIGAGDPAGANHAALQSFIVAGIFVLVITPLGIMLAEPILVLMGLEPDVVSEGAAYMRISLIASAFMSFRGIVESIMQSSGDSVMPMRVAVSSRLFQVILCPILVFGWWVFPFMGVTGAALADVIAQVVGLAFGFWILFTGRTRIRLRLRNFNVDWVMIWRIVKVGIPAAVMGMQRSLGNLILMWIISPFGTAAVAAHSLCQRIEMFLLMPGMGLGVGSGVLAGQNLGAGKPERAEKSGWIASGLGEIFMAACCVALLIWAEEIIGIFSPEPDVLVMGSLFLRIATAGFIFFSFEPVLMNFLSGAGDTIAPMLATIISFWALQIPLSYFLPHINNWGVEGVRWGMVIGMIGNGLGLAVYLKLGRWKHKKV
jgi:putative MATE family efflux protein